MSTYDPDTTGPSGSTATLERPDTRADERLADSEGGDKDRYAHYVKKAKLARGGAQVALCGKVWIPNHKAEDYQVCPACKAIYDQMKPGKGGDGE